MAYRVELTRSAARDVLALDDNTFPRVRKAIDALEENPRPSGARKLRGQEHAWRLRVGDYRALYVVDEQRLTITVYRIKHRREVYR